MSCSEVTKSGSVQAPLPSERWNLYLDLELESTPWPWAGRSFASITAADIVALHADPASGSVDFLRYSPTDGGTDWAQVPLLPREAPVCHTRLHVHHDEDNLFVFVHAAPPATPIPELVDCRSEDYCVAIPGPIPEWGFYFGMNQEGEHIGCSQVWNAEVFKLLSGNDPAASGDSGVMGWPGQSLRGRYDARVWPLEAGGRVAGFHIARALVKTGQAICLSVGRTCYATGEWVSWGAPIIWSPRHDAHGRVRLVDAPSPPGRPRLNRLDLLYNPADESATFDSRWSGTDDQTMAPFRTGQYKAFADTVLFALNGHEASAPLGRVSQAVFPIPDDWNHLEVMSTATPVQTLSFRKVSGTNLLPRPECAGARMPSREALRTAFANWHDRLEATYQGAGVWPWGGRGQTCLCHGGVFNIEPYLLADPAWQGPIHEARIRACCERALAAQKPAGWFPCTCSANTREPELGDGGAFTNGSVGEALVLASTRLDEPTWLAAAKRAADYAWYRWENNQNYAAFALWHLAALHEHEPAAGWLESALYLARNFVIRDIGPGGAQGGHNCFTGYANITLKGMARLLAVLPENDPFRPLLRNKTIRFANQILSRQQPNGMFAGRNRRFLGYQHPVPGLFFVAQAIPEQAGHILPALAAMTHAVIKADGSDPDSGAVLALASRIL